MTITNAYSVRSTGGPGRHLARTPYLVVHIPEFKTFGVFTASLSTNDYSGNSDPKALSWHQTREDAEKSIQVLIEAAKGPARPRYKLAED